MKTLYYYTSATCGPCRRVAPIFEKLREEIKDVEFVKINVEENREAASKAGIYGVPAFQLFEDGVKLRDKVGAVGELELRDLING